MGQALPWQPERNPISISNWEPALTMVPKDGEKEQTKSCSSHLEDTPLETLSRLIHSLLLKPLPCVLGRRQNLPRVQLCHASSAFLTCCLLMLPASVLGSPGRDRWAAGRGCGCRRSSASYLGHWACSHFLPGQVLGGKKASLKVD